MRIVVARYLSRVQQVVNEAQSHGQVCCTALCSPLLKHFVFVSQEKIGAPCLKEARIRARSDVLDHLSSQERLGLCHVVIRAGACCDLLALLGMFVHR